MRLRDFACLCVGLAAVATNAASLPPTVSIHPGDTATVVYDWSREHCVEWDTPDAPLRAFRDAQGGVVAFVSDADSRRFYGNSLLTLHHSCHSSIRSAKDPHPEAYDGERYVTATWSTDGKSVMALVHNEYHAEETPGACKFTGYMECWYNTVLAAASEDSGLTFTMSTPPTVVAAIPFKQEVDQGRHRGFFNPSNIFFHDGFYYMIADTTGSGGQREGQCLFRTSTIKDPGSWRGFDGHGYASRAVDPYRGDTETYVPCEPLQSGGLPGSVSWHAASGRFLMVFETDNETHPNGYTAYAWSKDLVHWTAAKVLLDHPTMASKNCADRYRYGYPSVADPEAPGRNFDAIGDHPVLFLTRFHVADCDLPANRDLIRLQLDIVQR